MNKLEKILSRHISGGYGTYMKLYDDLNYLIKQQCGEALRKASERDGCTFYENRKSIPYVAKELILDENNIPEL